MKPRTLVLPVLILLMLPLASVLAQTAVVRQLNGKVEVNDVLCEGCGTCSATCLRAAISVRNLTPLHVHDMIGASLSPLN